MPRVLLLLPTTTYRTEAFVDAASRLEVDVTVASEQANTLTRLNPAGLLTLDFADPQEAARQAVEFSKSHGIDAVVAVDSQVVVVGAAISAALGLRHNSVQSAIAAQNKHRMRQQFMQAGVPSPRFTLCSLDEDRVALAGRTDFPCVVKPLSLAASQGVIRADDEKQFIRAVNRLEAILKREHGTSAALDDSDANEQTQARPPAPYIDDSSRQFLVEQFVGGREVALEGMLTRGELHLLALFDKPDPLDGPFFEETIYVTPSRLAAEMQEQIAQCAARAARALGLTEGPIHAELRLTKDGPSVIEVNARSIGGLCSRMLRFGTGMSLEELIIRHGLEEGFNLPERQCQAAGVMMIPVQRAGQFIEVRRLDEAKAVSGIEDVVISAHVGQRLVPLPEGSQYLGFIFSRAESPAAVEAALRESHAQLEFVIEPFAGGEDNGTSLSEECIYRYLVRYGALGHVGRVGSINLISCRRGDRVVVNTDRGVELAEVLDASQEGVGRPNQERPAGELLRVATDEDRQREADLGDLHRRVLNASIELISERGLSVTAMDAEQLFDGQTIIVYYLGEPTEKLGPVAVDLSKKADNRRVQFQSIEMPPKSDTEDSSQPLERKPKRSKEELIKETSQFLRGTIRDELSWDTDKFSAADVSLLKFHGSYQQDDRDARKQRVSGVGKRHTFMARLKIPGGRLTAGQLLGTLDLCDRFADGTLRVTTRQGLQLHGVVKDSLWQTIHDINSSLLTTLGACGDVVRNVMCCPAPRRNDRVRSRMQSTASDLAKHFTPRTSAYFEIWVDGEKPAILDRPASEKESVPESAPSLVPGASANDAEPVYGETYLPRKLKIGVALPNDNCIDVYTQDIGLLAVVEAGQLVGYNVLVGGGLGNTPSVKGTFPRLADPLAFVPYAEVLRVTTAIVEVQRDYGNREKRRFARMKYLVDEWGVDRFKAKVEQHLDDETLDDPRPVTVQGVDDHLGWQAQGDGKFYFGLYIENGRIKDESGFRMKTGLRKLLERFRPPVRLTPQQSILLCDLPRESQEECHNLLGEHGISKLNEISNVRRHAIACPALPTCGLAITESERVLPRVIDRLETELVRLGLNTDEFTVRMTGCPNACARPYTADIGLVGKAMGKYTVLIGGNMRGDRLNFIYKDMVPLDKLVDELLPLLAYFKSQRQPSESLGDFCSRKGSDVLRRF